MKGNGRFGDYGGFYVAELLIPNLEQVEAAWLEARDDAGFQADLDRLLRDFAGRPTPLYRSQGLSETVGCEVYLKREDLLHGGAHKTNNTIAQALLAKRMGKTRLIAETGAGQHGVATAMAGALLGLEVIVFMGAKDVARQSPNVQRMKLFGAEVRPVTAGSQSLKDAINDTLRYWTETLEESFYVFGTVAGPHPFPSMVRDFQKVIGEEARAQVLEAAGKLPRRVVACVGGGSNAIGIFSGFVDDADVELVGVEPAGEGIETGRHGAPLGEGRPGCLHGSISYVLQNTDGQIEEAHSVSAGLDYPGVGPEHAWLQDTGRARYVSVTDTAALDAFQWMCRSEGILPALESSHAIAYVLANPGEFQSDDVMIINLSGRGDKDVEHVGRVLEAAKALSAAPPKPPSSGFTTSEVTVVQGYATNLVNEMSAQRGDELSAELIVDAAQNPDRLSGVLSALRERSEGAFMPFLVLSDPDAHTSLALTDALVEAGADLLEFGFAFSDPPADGPVVQAADLRALESGATTRGNFALLAQIRRRHPDVPVALLVYANLVFQYGVDAFYARCAAVGVDAVLVADVPLEESAAFVAAASTHGVAPVFIGSELSTEQRLKETNNVGRGYLYSVAKLGTTGEASEVSDALGATLARFREHVELPLLAGFGISTPDHVRAVLAAGADGVICGSAIVRRIAANLDDREAMVREVRDFARSMKDATR